MLFQLILAWFDRTISKMFSRTSMCWGSQEGHHRWICNFGGEGREIGIVGKDGRIHTIVGYWAVHHYYDGKKFLKRIPVRKDLEEGERLATKQEILEERQRTQKESRKGGGMSF